MKSSLITLAAIALCAYVTANPAHAHGHLNAGANPGGQLFFVNGGDFSWDAANNAGFIGNMQHSTTGVTSGNFVTSGPTITSLAPSSLAPEVASLGAYLVLRLESVSGPSGGSFSFWENGASIPSLTLSTGVTPTSPLQFNLTAGLPGGPDASPGGHIHGRRFSADVAGTYLVTFGIYDISTNGPSRGPIHTPSDPFTMRFDAVPEPSTWILIGIALAVVALVFRRQRFA